MRLSIKRLFDFTVAILGLLLFSPLLVCIGLAIRFSMGTPAIFRQVRPGLEGKPFKLYKFRTMNASRNEQGNFLPDEQRLTKLGQLLRRTSLDELPQLWNVVRGDMSLVGPRPLPIQYLERYSPEQFRRHEVLPGITGWAQVCGRNRLDWEERFPLDVWYVDHWSLGLDLKILVLTVACVIKGEGISSPEHATMPEFKGRAQQDRARKST